MKSEITIIHFISWSAQSTIHTIHSGTKKGNCLKTRWSLTTNCQLVAFTAKVHFWASVFWLYVVSS